MTQFGLSAGRQHWTVQYTGRREIGVKGIDRNGLQYGVIWKKKRKSMRMGENDRNGK
jgi:hypothetical protein